MHDDSRRQLVNRHLGQIHSGLQISSQIPRLIRCSNLQHRQIRLHRLWALAFHDLHQSRQGSAACSRLLKGLSLSITDCQDGLDLDQLTQQRLGAPDSSTFGQVFKGINHKLQPSAGDHRLDPGLDLIRGLVSLGHRLGHEHQGTQVARDRWCVDHTDV